jgi:hypothetical protein
MSQTLALLLLENCPKDNSRKYKGLPMKQRTKRYGIKKAPPPFSYAVNGNRQTSKKEK